MEGRIGVKFPCGYEYKIFVKGFSVDVDSDLGDLPTCPLHGKNCKAPRGK